ncbi:Zinc finger BED domain-containing protein [Actinidia chinensis var. chinensis]|uniref:Zinc finger BED domain-containing protein n=1 Tax=Actinidia chinensis var. chinensis TaxID=1590841 RepID=A0A2R6QI36_ACTCC|nr:Zinc finger BED domain-containing protein [Actinidia chinensis var. chinensis]
MVDGWTDQCKRTLINFLVYCPRGIVFLKSVDASDASKTAQLLYKLFREVILFVGPENVVHIVTDNAANYVAAGRLLEQEFHTIYWSPCAAHCMNLILQDIGNLDEVSDIISHASKITKYIYNHYYALHLMRKHTGGREILRPTPTRFATKFIALQSILAQKDALRSMVTSREWTISAYEKDSKGKKFVENVLGSMFWKECAIRVQLTSCACLAHC